ncbi:MULTISPECIES: O-methyltransferase [unclassified Cyanobium]|uniref:O-methyltransferase n=1 Tax=unclassified Cyanobium TaxID=2627006 RepID=UPI0020CC5C74|nr:MULTISPECIES: class I SAM-dependent methyltransferase [unclassified Cyanobium]MCP9857838.1 class I SAM-dependent methyltransferase [Cyanobium sp. Cruz-8H5]MCP9865105.1 class I SAM-dependent methyltransferase [Cyanobium sp. Cruz-8D1]
MNWLIKEIYSTGKVHDSGGLDVDLADCIDPREGEFLIKVIHENPHIKRTLEIGCAYGLSALHICNAVDGREGAIHTIIDPFQHTQWRGIGIGNLAKAGFHSWELIEKRSEHVLPELDASNATKYDLILIDGWHTFDHTIVDTFYATRLLNEGGILVVDDVNFPAVRSVINHLLTYPCYRLIGSVNRPRPLSRRQHLLRTLVSLLPKEKRELFLSSYVCQLVDSRETQSLMVALKKVTSDERGWDWHEPFA